MGIKRASLDEVAVAPYFFEEIATLLRDAGRFDHAQEELELGRGQVDRAAFEVQPQGILIETERTRDDHAAAPVRVRPSQEIAHAQHQFFRAEGLRHVVVGTKLEPGDFFPRVSRGP